MTAPAAAYDDQNIFAKILRGEIPNVTVYEDAETLCFMDIMPRADGHCLVIPKTPARNLLDVSEAQLTAVMATAQKVANAAMRAFSADGITLQQFSEAAGGAGGLSPAFPYPAAPGGCGLARAGNNGRHGGDPSPSGGLARGP